MNQANHIFFLTLLSLFAVLCAFHDTLPPKTVDSLQVEAFMGRWFQMYTSLIPMKTFEKDMICVIGDYALKQQQGGGLREPTTVSFDVVNSGIKGSVNGTLKQVEAVAINEDFISQPGKFKLKMDNNHDGNYWIIALGEIDGGDAANQQYPWAVISTPLGIDLFILARDVTEFQSKYEDQVLKMVHDKGFKYVFNKPIKTFQSTTECKYPAAPAPPTPPTPPTPPATTATDSQFQWHMQV